MADPPPRERLSDRIAREISQSDDAVAGVRADYEEGVRRAAQHAAWAILEDAGLNPNKWDVVIKRRGW